MAIILCCARTVVTNDTTPALKLRQPGIGGQSAVGLVRGLSALCHLKCGRLPRRAHRYSVCEGGLVSTARSSWQDSNSLRNNY